MRLPHDNVESSVLMTGLVDGVRERGRPRVCWLDNIVSWTGLSGTSLWHATRRTRDRRRCLSATHIMQPTVASRRRPCDITWQCKNRSITCSFILFVSRLIRKCFGEKNNPTDIRRHLLITYVLFCLLISTTLLYSARECSWHFCTTRYNSSI